MLTTETKEFKGVTFTTQKFPAMRGFKLLARVIKVAGPLLSVMQSSDNPDSEISETVMVKALASLNPDDVPTLAKDVLACTYALIDSSKGPLKVDLLSDAQIDRVFSGLGVRTMLEVLVWVLKFNFMDFSEGSEAEAPEDLIDP